MGSSEEVLDVHVDAGPAGDAQRGGANAFDPHAQALQVEAQVLDHVVGAGIADNGGALTVRGSHDGVLGHGIAAFRQHERAVFAVGRRGCYGVEPGLRLDPQPEFAQRLHVGLNGAGPQIAATGIRQQVFVGLVQERSQQHDDTAGPARCIDVHGAEIQHFGTADAQIAVIKPRALDADGRQDLDDPVDLFNPCQTAQGGGSPVDQAGTQQGHAGILAAVDVNGTG